MNHDFPFVSFLLTESSLRNLSFYGILTGIFFDRICHRNFTVISSSAAQQIHLSRKPYFFRTGKDNIMLTPQQLDQITFSKNIFGGYDTSAVDELLIPLTQDYTLLYKENEQLKIKMRTLVKKLEEYRDNETKMNSAAADTQMVCSRMIADTEKQCARMLQQAEEKAADLAKTVDFSAEEDTARLIAAKQAAAEKIAAIQAKMNACIAALEEVKNGDFATEAAPAPEVTEEPEAPKSNLTGKPSVDRPWMKFYPPGIEQMMVIPEVTLNQFLRMTCKGGNLPVIHYYGNEINWNEFFGMVDSTARAMRACGLGEGDQIPVLLRATPEFLVLLLAAEKIGASLLCRDNTIEENAEAIRKSGARIMFAHDFITREQVSAYTAAGAEKIVLVNPWRLAKKEEMPQHIVNCLKSNYTEPMVTGESVCTWEDFQAAGRIYIGRVEADIDLARPVYRCYTSGSTGTSKQVIHSAKSMLGVICQMSGYGNSDDFRPTWLVTILPPALVAVTVSMMLVPMASNRLLILDPFVDVYDIDLEMMRYKPNTWPLIPMFMEVLMKSKRIPADYDMSHLLACGAGAEATNNGQIRRAQKFLDDHNCHVTFSTSYGQSEACSNITFPAPGYEFGNGNVGIPMPLVSMTICRGTEEVTYGKMGEICVLSPGNMLGYDNEEATSRTLVRHEDGNLWLHTGDTGYMNEDGVVFTLGRGLAKRYHEDPTKRNRLVDVMLENLVSDANIPGLADCFFVVRPDKEHEGYFVPYMYAVLADGYGMSGVARAVNNVLEEYQRPVEIIQIPERPFYHFKTNRLHMEAPYKR